MLDVLAAIGIGAVIGTGARMLKEGVVINPSRAMSPTFDAISKENDRILKDVEWRTGDVKDKTCKCFSRGE